MRTPKPTTTLSLLWGTALVILVGGFLLARQERQIRVTRDRASLDAFSSEARFHLQRLDDLYQSHLMRLARTMPLELNEVGRAAGGIVGVLQVSLLPASDSGIGAYHAVVNQPPDGTLPRPAFAGTAPPGGDAGSIVLLDETRLFGNDGIWIDEPGEPLMFCAKCSAFEVAVILIDRSAIVDSVEDWLQTWCETSFEPVRGTGGPDLFRSGGKVLAQSGTIPESQPDLLVPLRSRCGVFEIASWDERMTVVHYHPAALTLTGTLAVVIGVLGFVIFDAQRRQQVIAAQRVSFVNRVSHELRTPLTNIMLNVDLAAEMIADAPQETARRLDMVRTESRRLGRLIDNVLTFARVEENKFTPRIAPCIPNEILSDTIDQFMASFQRKGLTIERRDENPGAVCVCDADAPAQIIGNLLSNVEKYVPTGVVRISSSVADGEWRVRVCDEGPGIPREAAERIFQPFERIHSSVSEGTAGTGLGLSIARDLARRLGGDLSLVPVEQPHGACFELRVPLNPPANPAHENPHRR